MKTCRHCQTTNAPANKFCQQCGRPLDPPTGPAADATVRWTGREGPVKKPLEQAVSVAALFGTKDRIVIGRAPDCDVCLPHPMVSRYHALVERRPEGLLLRERFIATFCKAFHAPPAAIHRSTVFSRRSRNARSPSSIA